MADLAGKTILHYRILEKLGQGGMGVVYKAEDSKLKREVAIKFLPRQVSASAEDRERFKIEAQAAAALNHANIATIHNIEEVDDETFIVMEYIKGQELKDKIETGPLPIDEALNIVIQIARGLQIAHEAGIVHRDIKASNIMLTDRGDVKIMDFGLAKLGGQAQLTKMGTTLGTAAYMSPEQARGEEVDHRTDIFSLGVLFYQMLAGSLPFKGDYEQAVVYSIINEEPQPISSLSPDLPVELETIINRCLSKDADERYAQVADFLSSLEEPTGVRVIPASHSRPDKKRGLVYTSLFVMLCLVVGLGYYFLRPASDTGEIQKSIAVLSFQDLSPNKDQEYFCDGMAEELINALTRLAGLHVAARTSAFYFKGRDVPIQSIGEELNVTTVLEGSVRKADNKLRISAQLINVSNGFHLWSETYDRELSDVFAIQEDISRQIMKALEAKLELSAGEPIVKKYTENEEAYNLYLQGRYFWNRRSSKELFKAVDVFNQAIALDSKFALAYAGLADAYNQLGDYELSPKEAYPKAKAAALKALEIDDKLANAHSSLAYVDHIYDWNWRGAEREFQRAIELNPNYPTAHQFYAEFLASQNRFDEAKAEISIALELDPLSLIVNSMVGYIHYTSRDYDAAREQLLKTLELDSTFVVPYGLLELVYRDQGLEKEYLDNWKKMLTVIGQEQYIASLDAAYKSGGRSELLKLILNFYESLAKREFVYPKILAGYYALLGQKESALRVLEEGFEQRAIDMSSLVHSGSFDDLRSEPRFQAILQRMKEISESYEE